MTKSPVHPDWLESPLVRMAIRRSGGTEAEAEAVLTNLLDLMTTLEERAPGVAFGELISAWSAESTRAGRVAARQILVDNGLTTEEIATMVMPVSDGTGSTYMAHPSYENILADYAAGEPMAIIAERYDVPLVFGYRCLYTANGTLRSENGSTVGSGRPGGRPLIDLTKHERWEEIRADLTAPNRESLPVIAKRYGIGIAPVRRALVALGLAGGDLRRQRPNMGGDVERLHKHPQYEAVRAAVLAGHSNRQILDRIVKSHRLVRAVRKELAECPV